MATTLPLGDREGEHDEPSRRVATARSSHTDQPYYVGGGKLIATVADADGNPVGLMQSP